MSVLKKSIVLASLGLSLLATGCQTWVPEAGVTLPSGEWLLHPPQFFPPSPPFPLPREMKSMQDYVPQYPPGVNPPG
jgi:hypothetical protein